jgi:hypothetical protein
MHIAAWARVHRILAVVTGMFRVRRRAHPRYETALKGANSAMPLILGEIEGGRLSSVSYVGQIPRGTLGICNLSSRSPLNPTFLKYENHCNYSLKLLFENYRTVFI